jgi:acyl-homoserine-lactone acylase
MNTCKRLTAHACVGALGLVLLSRAGSAEAPVNGTGEILWDEYAIPHIYGPDTETVLRGFGYAQMENQAEVILTNIATARGRRAEYFGPGPNNANVTSDVKVRTYDISRRAQQWLVEGTEEQRVYLAAFCDGLNEYSTRHGDTIDPSLRQILPVTPADVLADTQYTIHFTFLLEESGVPAQLTAWQAGKAYAADLDASARAANNGSNGWALAPKKSVSGNAILMASPHLPWGVNQPLPGLGVYQWIEANLIIGDPHHPSLNAYGATFPGSANIGIGFNDDIGWTHTDNMIKNADLYELVVTNGHYQFDGRELPLEHRRDVIQVRQADGSEVAQTIDIYASIQGPIVAQRADGHALALRVAGLDGTSIISEYWGMMRAHNLRQFIDANASLQMPFFNVIFADRWGEIMYLFGGKQPVRDGGTYADYAGILRGDTSKTLWTHTLLWNQLPHTINPPGGFVQNSNDPPWTATFPRTIRTDEYPSWIAPVKMTLRPQHGATFLTSKPRFSANQILAGKESTYMFLADRILPDLIAAANASSDATAKQAAAVLAAWDRTADANSVGGPLFESWYNAYVADPSTPHDAVFGNNYPVFRVEWTLDQPLTTPQGLADPAAAVPFLAAAARQLQSTYGSYALSWGDVHRIVLVTHDATFVNTTPISNEAQSGVADVFGPIRVIDSFPNPNPEARGALGYGGDSYVQLVEFAPDGPHALARLTYGNASRPGSPHITDQLPVFDAKTLRPVWRLRSEVEQHTVRREAY